MSQTSIATARKPTQATLALRNKLSKFIDCAYNLWKAQKPADIGQLATEDVLAEVKHVSTAFHCNSAGNIDLLWIKKDMPLEALTRPEVGYWRNTAGPGPKHEQFELVAIHGVPRAIMDLINTSNDHGLIADYLYPFFDFWNLCQYHILVIIACFIFSGSICIVQPTLLVVESTKMTRLFLDDMLVKVFQAGISEAGFTTFLEGNFDEAFLANLIAFTVYVIIWKDMPLSPEAWIHCYGVPVVVNYGPLPQHCGIAIPKQHPYRPYHSPSLVDEIVHLDRIARLMVQLARKIIAAAPPAPTDDTRREYMIRLRLIIVNQAVERGYWKLLQEAKMALQVKQQAFFSTKTIAAEAKIAEKGTEAKDKRLAARVAGGKEAVKTRNEVAVRAVGEKGSPERIAWVMQVVNSLRRDIEAGKTVKLLASPRNKLHGTMEHCSWLIHNVSENADLVNSAAGFGQLETPQTDDAKEARDRRQDAAGASQMSWNVRQISVEDALKKLAENVLANSSGELRCIELAHCPHCQEEWLIHDAPQRALHTCRTMRSWVLPFLYADFVARRKRQEDDEQDQQIELSSTFTAPSVTRCDYTAVFPWDRGEEVEEDAAWNDICSNKPAKKPRKRNTKASDPLWELCLDRAGRLTRRCLSLKKINTSGQLLSLPLAAELFDENKLPRAVEDVQLIKVVELLDTLRGDLHKAGLASNQMEEAKETDMEAFVAVSTKKKGDVRRQFLVRQVMAHFASKNMAHGPEVSRAQIEAAYMDRIALQNLRPAKFDWTTGVDLLIEAPDAKK